MVRLESHETFLLVLCYGTITEMRQKTVHQPRNKQDKSVRNQSDKQWISSTQLTLQKKASRLINKSLPLQPLVQSNCNSSMLLQLMQWEAELYQLNNGEIPVKTSIDCFRRKTYQKSISVSIRIRTNWQWLLKVKKIKKEKNIKNNWQVSVWKGKTNLQLY